MPADVVLHDGPADGQGFSVWTGPDHVAPQDLLFVVPREGLIAGLVTAHLAAKIQHEGDHVVARYVRTTDPADTAVQGDRSGLWHYQHQPTA